MKAIRVKILPATNTQPTRLKVFADDNKAKIVSLESYSFFGSDLDSAGVTDKAQYLAEQYLIQLGWNQSGDYRIVGGSHKNDYYFVLVYQNRREFHTLDMCGMVGTDTAIIYGTMPEVKEWAKQEMLNYGYYDFHILSSSVELNLTEITNDSLKIISAIQGS